MNVTLEDARRVIAAGEAKATEIGVPMNVAVVDAGTIVGAVGTSGGVPDQDEEVAEPGAAAL